METNPMPPTPPRADNETSEPSSKGGEMAPPAQNAKGVRSSGMVGDLRWSEKEPTSVGWWWWTHDAAEEELVLPVRSFKQNGITWFEAETPYGWMNVRLMTARFCGGRWAGPLPKPLEAPRVESSPTVKLSDTGENP